MIDTHRRTAGSLALAAILVVAGCGGRVDGPTPGATGSPGDASPTAGTLPPESARLPEPPTGLAGSVFVTGSSTVEPISSVIAERLRAANPGLAISVEGPGTGDGFEKFCNGEADVADASRPIQDEERETCAANGIEPIELRVAIDGLSVITSQQNTQVDCLSFADLYALLGPESIGFVNWKDAEPLARELGSNTTFPDAELRITAPGEESGTYDSFVEIVLEDIAEARGQEPEARPDYTSSANDNAIIEGIAGFPTSLGWVGFAFAQENADQIRPLAVSEEPNGECVDPTPESIQDGTYPIARPLFIYVDGGKAQENPAVREFVDYYLAEGVIEAVLEQVPYVSLTPEELDATRQAWADAGFGD